MEWPTNTKIKINALICELQRVIDDLNEPNIYTFLAYSDFDADRLETAQQIFRSIMMEGEEIIQNTEAEVF